MMVVVERAQTFMPRDPQSKSLCDPLDGEVAELLQFILFHCLSDKFQFCYTVPSDWSTR